MPVEPSVYTGTTTVLYNAQLLTDTLVEVLPGWRQSVINAQPLLKAFGLMAGLGDTGIDSGSYGNLASKREGTGRGVVFHDSSFGFEFNVGTTAPVGRMIGRMDNVNPQRVEPNVHGAYSYKRCVWPVMVPEEYVKDNKGNARLRNHLDDQMKMTRAAAARDVAYMLASHSSAPTGGATCGLPYLVSVTASQSLSTTDNTQAGTISEANVSTWANIRKAQTTPGGGGELDRPLALLRAIEYIVLTSRSRGGSSDAQMGVATQGMYQYYTRAAYADQTAQGARNQQFYDAGIDHVVVHGRPMIYDGVVQVPTGATASTEALYWLDLAELAYHVRRDEFFDVEAWDAPRPKDHQRYFQTNIWFRGIPAVTLRHIQAVLYNTIANPDAS